MDTEEEVDDKVEDEDEAVGADGIRTLIWSNRISIPTRSSSKISNSHHVNKIFQELTIDIVGRMERVRTHQAFAMRQLKDIVTTRPWRIA